MTHPSPPPLPHSKNVLPLLSVEHITMRFGGLTALNNVSFHIHRGNITSIIGPNGAGKTTLFNCLTGFYKPTRGKLSMRHDNGKTFLLERMPDHNINKKAKIARTFQNIRLFGGMTVLENLLVAQHHTLMKASGLTIKAVLGFNSYKNAEKAATQKAVFWLEQTRLLEHADTPASELSYGAQRRLEIARAMCTGPILLCLDEPAAGLNPKESAELKQLLRSIQNEGNTSILLIEHDMSVVMDISDHIIVLDHGEKIADAPPDQIKNDPKVISAYLGVSEQDVQEIEHNVHQQEELS